MISLNRAQILGRLTRDPEMRYTPNGRTVTSFGVATNRRFKTAEGNLQDQTEFHDVVAWGKLAEISHQFLHKGEPVYVEGRLQTRSWESPDGAKRQKTEIVAENVIALAGRVATVDAEPEEVAEQAKAAVEEKPEVEQVPTAKPKRATKKEKPNPDQTDSSPAGLQEINLDDLPF